MRLGMLAFCLGAALSAALPARATPVLGLALAFQESGAIGSTLFHAETAAFANALDALVPTDGSVAVSVIIFNTLGYVSMPLTTVTDANKASVITSITNTAYNGGGTNIATGITKAAQTLEGVPGLQELLVDVVTNGSDNSNVAGAVSTALAAGITDVNVLCAATSALGPNCGFASGPDSFRIDLANALSGDIAAAATLKLTNELALNPALQTTDAPEPASLTLFGVALAGLRTVRRRWPRRLPAADSPRLGKGVRVAGAAVVL